MSITIGWDGTERRSTDVAGRWRRARFGLGRAVEGFANGFPCNVIGHRNVEIPPSQLTSRERATGRLYFRCGRTGCGMRAGFTSGGR